MPPLRFVKYMNNVSYTRTGPYWKPNLQTERRKRDLSVRPTLTSSRQTNLANAMQVGCIAFRSMALPYDGMKDTNNIELVFDRRSSSFTLPSLVHKLPVKLNPELGSNQMTVRMYNWTEYNVVREIGKFVHLNPNNLDNIYENVKARVLRRFDVDLSFSYFHHSLCVLGCHNEPLIINRQIIKQEVIVIPQEQLVYFKLDQVPKQAWREAMFEN